MRYSKYVRVLISLMVVTLFATYLTKSLNVCLLNPSHLEDLSGRVYAIFVYLLPFKVVYFRSQKEFDLCISFLQLNSLSVA